MQAISCDARPRAPARPTRPASIAPSISSVLSDATTISAPIHVQRGFKTREAYLAALSEFAESKLYMPAGSHTVYGWYGGETMKDCKKRLRTGQGGTEAPKRAPKPGTSDANPAEASNSEQAGGGEGHKATAECAEPEGRGRLRRFSRVLSGRQDRRTSTATVS